MINDEFGYKKRIRLFNLQKSRRDDILVKQLIDIFLKFQSLIGTAYYNKTPILPKKAKELPYLKFKKSKIKHGRATLPY